MNLHGASAAPLATEQEVPWWADWRWKVEGGRLKRIGDKNNFSKYFMGA
jgi:hypothetical protein